MQQSRTQEIKEAFLRLNEADAAERRRILAVEAGRDPGLWQAAASLVESAGALPEAFLEPAPEVVEAAERARTRSGEFLEHAGRTTADPLEAGEPGQWIGRYRLLRPLGEGGFGVVWEAEQQEPLHRLVAVKLIRRGMDTRQIIARFAAERQALALMEHPHIARVLDAGSMADGRPFFVMELVIGKPIVEWCRDRNLDGTARLRLFELVCRAIQHAHDRGIVHRDIKPSNVLVAECDGEAIPKIIDFGIAKAVGSDLPVAAHQTLQRQLMGTPAYMAPEQIESRRGAVDAQSDVYALGVLLYELLTGSTPRGGGDRGEVDLASIARELDRPLPGSRRVSRLTHLPADLDWITWKCLEVDKERRYASARELAADVRRFLDDEPVLAGPPSLSYRLRKFCRRHRVAVGSAAALVGVGLVVATLGFFWASWKNHQLDSSNADLRARNAAYLREKAIAERALADVERLSDAHLLESLLVRAEEDLWPAVPDKVEVMRLWIEEAERLVGRTEAHRTELRAVLGRAVGEGERGVAALRGLAKAQPEYPRWDGLDASAGRSGLDEVASESAAVAEPPEDEARGPAFASTKDAWLHWLLSDLVERLDRFADAETGTLASVRGRLVFAAGLRERSVSDHRDAWDETIAGVLQGSRYPTLKETGFAAQLGLVPLGADPDSGLLEFLDLATHAGPIPERDARGRLQLGDDAGVVLVLVPGGTFLMGAQDADESAPNYDGLASANEGPVHEQAVEPFLLGKFELTQAQWMRLAGGSNPSYFYAGVRASGVRFTPRHPVEQVQWGEGRRVLRHAGLDYPTEAQWEYAARAGTGTPWFFGDGGPLLASFANIADVSARQVTVRISNLDDGFPYTAPVGSFGANPLGLHDVYGNVAEWCRDVFLPDYSAERPLREPLAFDELQDSRRRVVRGGSFNLLPDNARSARRHAVRGSSILFSVGVRAARAIQTAK